MLGPVVEDAIEGIAGDRTSSASRLARVALETMALATLERPGQKDPATLAEIARRISEPETARERIGKTFLKIAPDRATVLTLSYSESVRACLLAAHNRGRIIRVLVMEAGPVFEGRGMAAALGRDGIPVEVLTDEVGPTRAAEATYVLVGADSVLRDGSLVNKRGTLPLAQSATALEKPVYVACESLKFDARFDAASWPGATMQDLFDLTPGALITTVVTERGTYAPDILRTILAPGRDPRPTR